MKPERGKSSRFLKAGTRTRVGNRREIALYTAYEIEFDLTSLLSVLGINRIGCLQKVNSVQYKSAIPRVPETLQK